MIKWLKNLFKKKTDVVFYEITLQSQLKKRYNVRDKKGRFTKKGKK